MRTFPLAALATLVLAVEAAPALAQPAPEVMSPEQVVNPPSRGATPAAPPGTGAPVPFGQERAPYSTSPPDTAQGTGGSCVHPPCPQPPVSR